MRYTKTILKKLYITMLRIRLCEESFVDPIIKGAVRTPCHLYTGQEAVAAGVCATLKDKDYLFGNHRSHGHYLAKGGSMQELVAEIYGKETGCSRGRGGSMHLINPAKGIMGAAPIVAGTISLALGAALSSNIRKDKRVTVSFFGDGATGEGVLYESLNFASLKNLPILFVCENNLYATHMPISECRTHNNIVRTGMPFCVDSYRIDGNDVLKVYEVSKRAIAACRTGKGPVFLECMTYRLRGHVGPDDNIQGTHTDIRPKKEIAAWHAKDPLKRFESYLSKHDVLNIDDFELIREQVKKEVDVAFAFAQSSPYPEKGDLAKYVYAG
jgi:acetoin:2,6-dichlorophenolindophenol oxidoreductase subunit alpha